MSTHRLDDILAQRAEEEMARRLSRACKAFVALVSAVRDGAGAGIDSRDVRSLVLSECISQEYDRNNLVATMAKERKGKQIRTRITAMIQRKMGRVLYLRPASRS